MVVIPTFFFLRIFRYLYMVQQHVPARTFLNVSTHLPDPTHITWKYAGEATPRVVQMASLKCAKGKGVEISCRENLQSSLTHTFLGLVHSTGSRCAGSAQKYPSRAHRDCDVDIAITEYKALFCYYPNRTICHILSVTSRFLILCKGWISHWCNCSLH